MLRVVLTSIISFIFTQSIATGKFDISIRKKEYLIYNFISVFLFYTLLNLFFWNYEINFLIVILILYVLSVTMYYIHEFRGTNINLSDILSINTAKEVAGGYKYQIKPVFIISFLVILFEFIYHICFKGIDPFKNYNLTINTINTRNINNYVLIWHELFQILAFFISFFLLKDKVSESKFDYSLSAGKNEGYIYNFVSSIPLFHVVESIDHDEIIKSFINEINQYKKESNNAENTNITQKNVIFVNSDKLNRMPKYDDLPNIIVIMNESFGSVHNRVNTNIPVTPYYDSLSNVVKGNLYVNTFGGGTANTEFEFLTCMSIGNYPYPVMPYNNFVNTDKYSIAKYFNNMGYHTIAMHPYTATNYHRDVVYKRFGFKKLMFYDDFKHKQYIRNFVSDESMYNEVIHEYEKTVDSGEKLFLFGITMQNHSGYQHFNEASVKSSINIKNKESIDSYLSLMRLSDNAIKVLIKYFSKAKERTLILFFGDHNASFGTDINKILYNNSINYECTNAYATPFFIYDNKNKNDEYIDSVSANFLSLELLKKAGLPLDTIHTILDEVYNEYSTYNFHKMKNKSTGKISYIEDNNYTFLEREYLK